MNRNHLRYQSIELPEFVETAIYSSIARTGIYRSIDSSQWHELAGYLTSNQEMPFVSKEELPQGIEQRIQGHENEILNALVVAGAESESDEIKSFPWYQQMRVIYLILTQRPTKTERRAA